MVPVIADVIDILNKWCTILGNPYCDYVLTTNYAIKLQYIYDILYM